MDHNEVRELLELAAAEPNGIDRLIAGDTPTAAAAAGHMAGCPDCTAEVERLRRLSMVVRDVILSSPPPELRARTLDYIAAVGRPRGAGLNPTNVPAPPATVAALSLLRAPETMSSTPLRMPTAFGRRLPAWLVAVAAAVVLAVAGTWLAVGAPRDAELAARDRQLAEQRTTVAALARIATWTVQVEARPDSARVALAATGGGTASGTIVLAPATREIVIVAQGIAEPREGEYRCWFESGGQRSVVGRMFFGGGLSYWAGQVGGIADAKPGTTFGVSLVGPDGSLGGEPVLFGWLQGG